MKIAAFLFQQAQKIAVFETRHPPSHYLCLQIWADEGQSPGGSAKLAALGA